MRLTLMTGFQNRHKSHRDLATHRKGQVRHDARTIHGRVAIASWKTTLGRADKAFAASTEEQFLREVAPGKNRLIAGRQQRNAGGPGEFLTAVAGRLSEMHQPV